MPPSEGAARDSMTETVTASPFVWALHLLHALRRFFLWEDKLVTGVALGALHVIVWEGWLVGTLHLLLACVVVTMVAHASAVTGLLGRESKLWNLCMRLRIRLDPTFTADAVAGVLGVASVIFGVVVARLSIAAPRAVGALNKLVAWKDTWASLRCVAYLWVAAQVVAFLTHLTLRTTFSCLLWSLAVTAVFAAGWFIAKANPNPAGGPLAVVTRTELAQFKAAIYSAAEAVRERVTPLRIALHKLRAQAAAALPTATAGVSGVPTALLVALVAVVIDRQLNIFRLMTMLKLVAWATCLWDASRVVDAVDMLVNSVAKQASRVAD